MVFKHAGRSMDFGSMGQNYFSANMRFNKCQLFRLHESFALRDRMPVIGRVATLSNGPKVDLARFEMQHLPRVRS